MKANFYFVDASFDNKSKIGIGAYRHCYDEPNLASQVESLAAIKTAEFSVDTAAEAELEAINWLMHEIMSVKTSLPSSDNIEIVIFSDCQMVTQLSARRSKLEAKQFQNRFSEELALAPLYRKFYALHDQVNPSIFWIKGHKPSGEKSIQDKIFSSVDQAARTALRRLLTST